MAHHPHEASRFPVAAVHPMRRRWLLAWIPLAALVFVAALLWIYVIQTGPTITVRLADGHGIGAGDVLRCRGIVVGEVESTELTGGMDRVVARVRLKPDAAGVARGGSRFWVVRPRLGLNKVTGLDTLAGARYLAVLPGVGELRREFTALRRPPPVERIDSRGLEIVLLADRLGGLRPGAPVLYRQVRIGAVLSAGLASDAASIRVRAYIRPRFTDLVREDSRFWSVSGGNVSLGITGLHVRLESLESLLVGGVAMATPDPPGEPVHIGHRFALESKAKEAWLKWTPALPIGTTLLPAGAPRPVMLRATLRETTGRFWRSRRQRRGWLLPTPRGLLGPADLLRSEDAEAALEVAGRRIELPESTDSESSREAGLSLARIRVNTAKPWPLDRTRRMKQAEDLLVFTDAASPPVPVAAARLRAVDHGWRLAPVVSFDDAMNGAAVLARSDAMLVGLLRVREGRASILPVPDLRDASAAGETDAAP